MPETADDRLVIYSDYVCPFCYLGKASLDTYREQADQVPEVEWRPFDLRARQRTEANKIDHDIPDGKDEAYYARAKENVQRLADAYGVEMTLDIAEDVDAWDAHKVAVHLDREGQQETLSAWHDAVFDALWKQGRDIGHPDVLVDIGETVGLEAEAVREAIASERLEEVLEERFAQAHRAGVRGVPTFAYGQLAIPGAIPPENIKKLIENG